MTAGKFVIQLTGPALKYRLDILAKVCPEIRHFLICLTNQQSYDFYKDYHNFFEFVIMDDYRKDYPTSLKHEVFPEYKTEEEFFANIRNFYGSSTGKFYPYDIHRFIFPYLMERNIVNFTFSDTDFIVKNDFDLLNKFFQQIPVGSLYGPWHGEDVQGIETKKKLWNDVQKKHTDIPLTSPFLRTHDGWMRGFHFKNLSDMKFVFDVWNTALDTLYETPEYYNNLAGHNGIIIHTEWIISHIMQFLEHNRQYSYDDCHKFLQVDNLIIGRHHTRVEDTLHLGQRQMWNHFNFDYSDVSTIAKFVQNNKHQLYQYYDGTFKVDITDTHVYTSL